MKNDMTDEVFSYKMYLTHLWTLAMPGIPVLYPIPTKVRLCKSPSWKDAWTGAEGFRVGIQTFWKLGAEVVKCLRAKGCAIVDHMQRCEITQLPDQPARPSLQRPYAK